jgi:hypothetical protein
VRDAQPVDDPIVIEAPDDAAAIDLAERFLNGVELQVWQTDRLVVTLKAARAADDRGPRLSLSEADSKNPAAGQPGP